jgi:hypothetical protein
MRPESYSACRPPRAVADWPGEPYAAGAGVVRRADGGMRRFDAIDRKLLALLQSDDRLALAELSKRAGVAASTINDRIKRLVAQGVISGFHARLDPEKLGLELKRCTARRPSQAMRLTAYSFSLRERCPASRRDACRDGTRLALNNMPAASSARNRPNGQWPS